MSTFAQMKMLRKPPPRLILAGLALLLSGCSWFDWSDDDAGRAQRITGEQTVQSPTIEAPRGETMAERRLRDVYDKQQALYARLAAEGASLSDPEYDRLINEVATEYHSYISDYPQAVYGYILFGKFLRDTGQYTEANTAFIRANQLDREIAVVKQQIGNYLAEEGEPSLALAYYMAAAELEPNTAVYAYQIGELLYTYRDEFIAEEALEPALLDQQMIHAFAEAHRLNPSNRQLTQRYAEAYFDVGQPDWPNAFKLWQALEFTAKDSTERDWARLQKARVLINMGKPNEAREVLSEVNEPGLQPARQQLLNQLG